MESWRRADLHLHTLHSGWRRLHLIDARDSYLTPETAFRTAIARGMDFVCFTDHDSIDGALEFLSRHPEEEPRVIVGEEREVRLPGTKQWLHLAVYGLNERDHRDLARLKDDAFQAIALLRERRLLFALNHPFQSFRSIGRARRDLLRLLPLVPAVEVANSSSPRSHRGAVEAMLDAWGGGRTIRPARIGGSDAHTTRRIAATYTLAPGRTKEEFLRNIARGECAPAGEATGLASLVRDVYQIIGEYYRSVHAPGTSPVARRDRRNILGSIGLLPGVLFGVPVTLTSLHVLRQEWIARAGRWGSLPAADAIAAATAPIAPLAARPDARPDLAGGTQLEAPFEALEARLEPDPALLPEA